MISGAIVETYVAILPTRFVVRNVCARGPHRDEQQRQDCDDDESLLEGDVEFLEFRAILPLQWRQQKGEDDARKSGDCRRIISQEQDQNGAERDQERRKQPLDDVEVHRFVQFRQALSVGRHHDGDSHPGKEQKRRDEGGKGHIDIRDVEKLGDEESGQAQDRRHDLTRTRRDSFHCTGHFLSIPVALHHRNGQAPGQHYVSDRLAHH